MKRVVSGNKAQFVSAVISQIKSFQFRLRMTALLLMSALLIPCVFFNPTATKTKAQINLPIQQSAPINAPPEPYLFSSGKYSVDISPSLETIVNPISNSYSAISTFFEDEKKPEGLGAATEPPTFGERFSGFFASIFSNSASTSETSSNSMVLPSCSSKAFDFDGDGLADVSRWQANSFQYKIYNSSTEDYTTLNLGSSASKIAPADFDGDGKFDPTVFSAGSWTVRKSSTNTNWSVTWGTSGDLPYPADYDGDCAADFAIYRPSTNTFWVLTSSSGYNSYTSTALGASGDVVVPGDYDGDAKADHAVFRPSNGNWYYLPSSGGSVVQTAWGVESDIPAPADFDGDGLTDQTVFRPSTGTWYILKSTGGSPNYLQINWGNLGDQPVQAEYDGDGLADIAIYRPTTGAWWILKSSDNFEKSTTFSLGTSSDTAVPSAFLKQSGGELLPNELNPIRLAPINQTGGTDLYSRNFGWGQTLVSLPGRAGMNLGIGVGYNSLVWTKINSTIAFDVDKSNLTPGFNFGFPRIEPAYLSSQTSMLSYLMVSPSGARTEFRQTSAGDTYETADSSYAQVKVNNPGTSNSPTPIEDITLTVSGTDGTKMEYAWIGNAYRCTKITDRNGNYISISNNSDGLLTSVTDTLGRVITINYDSYSRLSSITQNWQTSNGSGSNTTHTWASFAYTTKTISTSFDTNTISSIFGPANNTSITVLDKITYPNGAFTKFEYNGYGQVFKVSNVAADSTSHVLNYVRTNLESPSSNQPDCPRFSETRSWVENFNLDTNNVAQEIIVSNSITANASYSLPGSISGTATKIEVEMANDPYGAVTRMYVGASGWQEGLTIATEDMVMESSLTRKRWSWTSWTQDDTSKSYIVNPRTVESRIGDTTNTKRSTTEYYPVTTNSPIALYGLVKYVKVYDTDLTTVLKEVFQEYNLDTAYVSRRIIGLPSLTRTAGYNQVSQALEVTSKVTYSYDEGTFGSSSLAQNISPTRHDGTNFSSSFVTGRGNLTSTKRWDALDETNTNKTVTVSAKYNTAGLPVEQTDAGGRKVEISYTDSFNDNNNSRNTFAFPTKLTEVAYTEETNNNFSLVKYRFDTGANVWAKSPKPANNSSGKETTREYDSIGRLQKETLVYTGAYTRYEYPTNGIQSKVYTTINDVDGDNNIAEDEVYSESWTDGAGRVRKARTEHPNSTGGWTGTLTEYDILGRVTRSTVPTEINSNYEPAGDDATRGWLWTQQEYDWKSRVTRTIHPDSTGTDGKDMLYSYDGCGCAGGQVTTVQGELVPRDDQSGNARRTQKVYEDILGRTFKTEIYNWDGTTVYTTTVQTFNGRDQVLRTQQYAGAVSSSTYQDVTMSYDGHGRMKTRHYPIEDSNKETSWIYNDDDSIQQIIDPRGAITDFDYNTRGLVEEISYTVPSSNPSNMTSSPTTTFSYDALGNRTQMATSGVNTTSYSYDALSRLTSETVDFDGLTSNLTISYTYHLGGALKSITDPFNSTVNYTNDKTGRVREVIGTPWAQNTTGDYADDIEYRAFGQIKRMDYNLPDYEAQINLQYDNRLRVSHSEVVQNSNDKMKADFAYFADSRVQSKDDLLDNKWDRTMKYDFGGRLKFNQFGIGLSWNNEEKRVYEQTVGYDAFSQMTTRSGVHWERDIGYSESYTNGRINNFYGSYDAAGNIYQQGDTNSDPHTYRNTTFDAAGRRVETFDSHKGKFGNVLNMVSETKLEMQFDGNGRMVVEKRGGRNYHVSEPPSTTLTASPYLYQVWSTVLGSSLTTVTAAGDKLETKVFAGNTVIAKQYRYVENNTNYDRIEWRTADPVTGTVGVFSYMSSGNGFLTEEQEPLGQKVDKDDPEERPDPTYANRLGNADDPQWQCQVQEYFGGFQGMPFQCQMKALLEAGDKLPWEEEMPTNTGAPPGQSHGNTGRDAMPVNLTSVNKPSPEMSLNRKVINASVAGSGGAEGSEEECQLGADGKPNCFYVDVKAPLISIDMEDTGLAELGNVNFFEQRTFTSQEWNLLLDAYGVASQALDNETCRKAILDGTVNKPKNLPGNGDPRNVLTDIFNRGKAAQSKFGANNVFFSSGQITVQDVENFNKTYGIVRDTSQSDFASAGTDENKYGFIRIGNPFYGDITTPGTKLVSTMAFTNRPNISNEWARALILLHEIKHIITGDYSKTHGAVFNDKIYNDCFKNLNLK